MKNLFSRPFHLAAALLIAGAGILEVIDQTTMMVLVIVLVILPNARSCSPMRRDA